jgi:hypothetical protein
MRPRSPSILGRVSTKQSSTCSAAAWGGSSSQPSPKAPAREAAVADVSETLLNQEDSSGIRLRGGFWLVAARKPNLRTT